LDTLGDGKTVYKET
jgi:hypothetical protein